jgi:hypothetical protein
LVLGQKSQRTLNFGILPGFLPLLHCALQRA